MRISLTNGDWLEVEDTGAGPALVLLHAFPLASAMWQPQHADLADQFRLITPDLRGFGGSSEPRGTPSVEQWADDVAALLDKLSLHEPVVLGGVSMGGYVTLAFQRRYPQRVRLLILADTRAEADNTETKANRDKSIELARQHSPGQFVETMLPKLLGPKTHAEHPEVVAVVRQIGAAQRTGGIIAALQALRDRPDSTDVLGQIKVPTLIVVGADDILTPPSLSEVMASKIAGSELVTLEGAGHLSNLECPAAFNRAVRSFLGRLPPP